MDELERELKVGFLEEAAQLLEDAEQFFLQLETNKEDVTIIEAIFRLAHNLKGSGRAVGFAQVAEFTHVLESLLLKIKNKEISSETSIVNLLLRCNDHLKVWVGILKGDLGASVDSHELITELQAAMAGQLSAPAAAAPAPAPVVEAPPPAEIASPYPSADQFDESSSVSADDLIAALNAIPGTVPAPAAVNPVVEVEALAPAAEPAKQFHAEAVKPEPKKEAPKEAAKNNAANEDESIRVSLKRVETLINNVGELVIMQTVLNQQRHLVPSPLLQRTIAQLAKITKDIQDIAMGLRMVPLKQTFQKMQRIVRDTSKVLGKDIEFTIQGENTELDKTVVDQLGDPLVHLIRNSCDHGVEDAEGRTAAGKPAKGKVSLSAFHKGGQIVIEVKDDGKGLNAAKLTEKAIEKGIIKPGTVLSEKEAHHLIFAAGFSTKAEVTEVSGRGVGMDVVKNNIEKKLQGEVQLDTVLGHGSTFRIILPLTLAIIDGMVVRAGDERYIVPLAHVFESLQPKAEDVHFVTGVGEVLSLRGDQLPLYRLGFALGRKVAPKPAHQAIALIVRQGDRPFAVLVDDILGQQQIVIKQLGVEVKHLKGISGGAILGDGRAALILDLTELCGRMSQIGPAPKEIRGVV